MEPQESKGKNKTRKYSLLSFVILFVIISALVMLFMPTISGGGPSRKAMARTEIMNLEAAINQYLFQYSRLPVPTNISDSTTNDITFGTYNTSAFRVGITNASGYQANNSEIMGILMGLSNFPDGRPVDQSRNPRGIQFLVAKMVDDTNSSGIGLDGVYRDPWGHPYIITMDTSCDNKCLDAFYRLDSVSEIDTNAQGLNGLTRPTSPLYPVPRNSFEAPGRVMVWSLGPDGKADRSVKADAGVNKDNILSWH